MSNSFIKIEKLYYVVTDIHCIITYDISEICYKINGHRFDFCGEKWKKHTHFNSGIESRVFSILFGYRYYKFTDINNRWVTFDDKGTIELTLSKEQYRLLLQGLTGVQKWIMEN